MLLTRPIWSADGDFSAALFVRLSYSYLTEHAIVKEETHMREMKPFEPLTLTDNYMFAQVMWNVNRLKPLLEAICKSTRKRTTEGK